MIEDHLRDAGLKATRARIGVYAALEQMSGHRTADEVLVWLITNNERVSRATVFNVLDDLADAGLVTRADAGPGAARFELATVPHHHFVCDRCGEVSDVPAQWEPSLPAPAGEVPGRVDSAQVVYRGVCSKCLDAEA